LYYTLAFTSFGIPPGAGQIVVDVSDTLQTKLEAIRCYETQFGAKPEKQIEERVKAFAVQLGTAAGFPACEMFSSPRLIGTRDLMHFLFGQKPGDQPAPPEPPR